MAVPALLRLPANMADSSERRKQWREHVGALEKRTWHLCALSLTVTATLALAIAAFFFPAIVWKIHRLEIDPRILPQLVVGLLTLVALLSLYIIKKQRELSELRDFIIASYAEASQPGESLPHDSLTGTLDRRTLPDVLKRETTWVDRYRIPLSLVLFNIREFHTINMKEGNLAGDLVLKDLAQALMSTVRQSDTVLRHGPDEFLCFLPRTDRAGGEGFIRRVVKRSQETSRLRGVILDVGLGVYEAGMDSDLVLAGAEKDLASRKPAPAPVA